MKNQSNQTKELEYLILTMLEERYSCADEILQKLKNNEVEFEERKFYPILSGLLLGKLLCYNWLDNVDGLPIKHYHLTRNGFSYIHK